VNNEVKMFVAERGGGDFFNIAEKKILTGIQFMEISGVYLTL
jgi:hypothetical protein